MLMLPSPWSAHPSVLWTLHSLSKAMLADHSSPAGS
ncbi:EGF-like domain 7, isoform CRA_a [Rattus norvegicus]|uniref:EGF-like domain 7, isoform CRA_a n=1 Tax=Rattus norvegicus TaxID=10116 RepID=A6JTG3_RAT|nr:EGF-like domain 7, isoform CRA_a [Rattus norvegicus]EDL93488.1 EGF-like domain 7, isoform CRA_a [Rattus norvegicus]